MTIDSYVVFERNIDLWYTSNDTNNTVSLTRITVHENSSKDQHSNVNARTQVRRDWYYDRTAWRSDLTNCCVTESQLYFAMHRFQHDALDWIAIGDVLPDMDRRDFLRGAKLNERATIPDLRTHVLFFSEGYKETLLRDAGVNMLRAFPSICKFVGQPHDGRIVQVPKKTAQWLRVAAAHHFDDAVRGVRVRSYYSLLSSNVTNT